jgi:hypothetical protein
MKMIANILIWISLGLQLGGCKPDEPVKPTPPVIQDTTSNLVENKDFDLVYYKRMGIKGACYATVVTEYNVIYAIQQVGNGHNDAIIALDKTTGDSLWVLPNQGATSNYKLLGNILYYNSRDRLAALDIRTGTKLWQFSGQPYGDGELGDYTFGNNQIFAFINFGDKWQSQDSMLVFSVNPSSGNAELKYKMYTKERQGYRPSIQGAVYWQHPDGRDIVFCQSRSWNTNPVVNQERADFFAVDINNDSLYWDLGFYYYQESNTNSQGYGFDPMLVNNDVFISYREKTSKLNLVNKNTIWDTEIPYVYQTSRREAVISMSKIYCQVGNSKSFNVVNASDGSFVAGNKQMGGDFYASPLRVYDNAVWCTTTTGLYKVDDQAQKLAELPNEETVGGYYGSFQNGMDIDQETGYIYTTRGYAFVCLKEKE